VTKKTTILLVDDHRIFREGLRSLLDSDETVQVVGEADSGRSAIQEARRLRPDVVVMDVGMPDLNGIEATQQIVSMLPRAKVIGLSMHSDKRYIQRMFQAGASGYLKKDCAYPEMSLAVRAVRLGHVYLGPSIGHVVVEQYSKPAKPETTDGYHELTPRQREVLQLLAEGQTSKQIAAHLHTSVKTVEAHRQTIMKNLNIRSIAELTKFAIREGLTSLEP